ncbi:hypothetical protein Exig_1642 [Exiguobacterium sibiricum 255-15]|uniref:Uncharacterized protein n=1 Tax=Exiguobacterium sibiricum (strain DSM 17290 / CCUG 55495 / CIP 109462 / JCM 13490 / 255-15) TaxID=262543 RepID=B1YH36_EXIS2|nr:hypothetical protein [Exiguobacterium sibiricum]ACB61097.1 hypothetical protein Exig_1642 [Exiguobacterium sibiricum 255-15]
MVYCIGMFVLGVVALTARGLYFDIFRITERGSLVAFLPAALLLFWIERWQQKRDTAFNGGGTGYTSLLSDRQSTGIKQIYRSETIVGSYRRTFEQAWHRWFVAFPKVENFFLNLDFDLSQRELRFEEKAGQRLWSNQTEWMIEEGGETVGDIQTENTVRHAVELTEVLNMTYRGETYQIRSPRLSRRIEVRRDKKTIATSHRKRHLLTFDVPDLETRSVLLAGMILFRLHFRE